MRLSPDQRITSEEAKRRALIFLCNQSHLHLSRASEVGHAIWPENNLRAQGLAFAAGRTLRQLQEDGMIIWGRDHNVGFDNNGYAITASGRKWVGDHA